MKVSIVIAVLDSHEIVRRQLLHFKRMPLPEDVEVILVDDGSNPPLAAFMGGADFLSVYRIDNKGYWTQPAARNYGAKKARGAFCIFTDIDHIVTREIIEVAKNTPYDVVRFRREVAVLDEQGGFTQDWDELHRWGFDRDKLKIRPHSNSYIMRTKLFLDLGGVSEQHVGTSKYPNREELPLKRKLKGLEEKEQVLIWQDQTKPMIYMFPNGHYCNNGDKDHNPFGFFHSTTRSIRVSRRRQKEHRRVG